MLCRLSFPSCWLRKNIGHSNKSKPLFQNKRLIILKQINQTNVTSQHYPIKSSVITYLKIIENICVLWFTFEYLIRLITSPYLTNFMLDFLNIVDILCILPFYFGLFLNEYPFFLRIRYLMQMLRVLRLLKLGRYSDGIKSFSYALKTSSTTLAYLLVLIAFNVIIFSSILYFAENEDPDTKFTSIIASCWYYFYFEI